MRAVGFLLAILTWSLVSAFSLVDPVFIASPWSVILEAIELAKSGAVFGDICATLLRILAGVAFGGCCGFIAGCAMGTMAFLRYTCSGLLDFLRSIPVVVLFPLFVLCLGIGDTSKIAGIAWSVFPIMAITTTQSIAALNPTRVEWMKLAGIRGTMVSWQCALREMAPTIVTGLRLSVASGIITCIVAEMLYGTTRGVGRLIYDSATVYATARMYCGILAVGSVGFVANEVLCAIEGRLK